MFLKNRFGNGYILSVDLKNNAVNIPTNSSNLDFLFLKNKN